jgi:hypothetical protein
MLLELLADLWTLARFLLVPGAFQAALDRTLSPDAWQTEF